jgi:hypothetical protein
VKVPDWLDHLRRDRYGRPIPQVNRWGLVEKLELAQVQFDPLVGGNAAFYFDAGETEPDFTRQNVHRQRRSVITGECQVCGRQVPWKRRHLVISSVSTSTVQSRGPMLGRLVVSEPWMDARCAEFAITKCPELIRRSRGEDLTLISVTSPTDVDIVFKVGAVEGHPHTWQTPVVLQAEICVKALDQARV